MIGAILQSIGGLGLFLLGMSLLTDGLKTLAGSSLQRILRRFTRNPTTGAVSGAVVTAVVQSSSATTITAVGLVGAGLLTFPHALGILFGANIGTTATGWLVAVFGFKVPLGTIAMPLVLVGVLLRLFASDRLAALGYSLAGFAVIFIAIGIMQSGMANLEGLVTPESFPGNDLLGRLELVAIGVAITLVTQSSSAGVATAMTALHTGTIGFEQAAALVIGMDVGTTVTAVLATLGGSAAVKRTGYAHLIYNLMTGTMAFALLTPYINVAELLGSSSDPELFLVGFHTFFNTLGVFLVLPLAGRFGRMMERLVPAEDKLLTRYLEPRVLKEPGLALEAVESTLREVTALALSVLRPILAGAPQRALDEALPPLRRALDEAHEFLEELGQRKRTNRLGRKAVHLIYAADHLDRLVVRLASSDRVQTVVATKSVQQAAVELGSIVERTEKWVRTLEAPGLEADARQAWQRLETHNKDFRRQVMELAASSRISAGDSIAQLDAMRWLVRVGHHLWRLIHHMNAAGARQGAERGGPAEHEADS